MLAFLCKDLPGLGLALVKGAKALAFEEDSCDIGIGQSEPQSGCVFKIPGDTAYFPKLVSGVALFAWSLLIHDHLNIFYPRQHQYTDR